MSDTSNLAETLAQIRACTHCAAHLPLGPRPIVRAQSAARILIIGQAPGTRVHESGIPWDDRSGERLRDWMQLSPAQFYDESKIAIMPMGFCYPGVQGGGAGDGSVTTNGGKDTDQGAGDGSVTTNGGKDTDQGAGPARRREAKNANNRPDGDGKKPASGGDQPPRPECAPMWHEKLVGQLPNIQLTLLVGQYAQKYYLGRERGKSLTETVSNYAQYLPAGRLPLPHPSWRVAGWQKKHLWFEADVLPVLRHQVSELIG